MKICPKCGKTYADDWKVCLNDDVKLVDQSASGPSPLTKAQIEAIAIEIRAAEQMKFYVFAHKDGSIKRSGEATMGCADSDIYVGAGQKEVFSKMWENFDEAILRFLGKEIDLPEKKGAQCTFTLTAGRDGDIRQLRVHYGQQSGLTAELYRLIRAAHEATEPWFKKMQTVKQTEAQ